MSKAMQALKDFLTASPSVVAPDEVLELLRPVEHENAKLRDIAHDMWRLLLATGNDDLVLSIEAGGVVKEVIDADELAKTMRELGIES